MRSSSGNGINNILTNWSWNSLQVLTIKESPRQSAKMRPGNPLSLLWDPEMEANPCAHDWGLRFSKEVEAEVEQQ